MADYRYVIFSDAVPGREAEFDRWYEEVHLGDVLKLPGFVAAQRFENADPSAPEGAHARMAIYEIESDDIEATMGGLFAAAADGRVPLTDAMRMPPTTFLFRTRGPRRTTGGG